MRVIVGTKNEGLKCNTPVVEYVMAMSTKETIEVPVETYSDVVPDWYEGDQIPIKVSAFGDKVYLKFPQFSTVERKIQGFLQNDSTLHGSGSLYPIDRSEITEREEALEAVMNMDEYDREYIPRNTTDYCVDVKTLVKSVMNVGDRGRKLVPLMSNNDELDDLIRDMFVETVDGHTNDEYLKGYQAGISKGKDEHVGWADMWEKVFHHMFDGDQETMLEAGKLMAKKGEVPSNRSYSWFQIPNWGTPTGSYVATIAESEAGVCPDCGADKDEHWRCVQSSNRTRVPNVYKCEECGNRQKGITTG